MESTSRKTVAILGCDSSHVIAFVKYIQNHPEFKVKYIYDNYQSTIPISVKRRDNIKERVQGLNPNIIFTSSITKADAFMILNVDATQRIEDMIRVNIFDKPVFIDKPLVFTTAETAFFQQYGLWMSTSALRYQPFYKKTNQDIVIEAPLSFQEGIPYFHWYGIHAVEMLYANKVAVEMFTEFYVDDNTVMIKGTGYTIKWYFDMNRPFSIKYVEDDRQEVVNNEYMYNLLFENILEFFSTRKSSISKEETIEIIKYCDRLNTEFNKSIIMARKESR